MPNYCDNHLRIKFNKKENLEEFVAKHFVEGEYGKEFDFDTVIPEPTSSDGLDPKYLVNENSHIQLREDKEWFEWYEWHCDKWGTKWNAFDTSGLYIDDDGLTLCFSYETAWSPSIPIIKKLAKMYKFDFIYTYYECGMGFAGQWTRENGVLETEEVDGNNDFEYRQFLLDNELEEKCYLEEQGYIIEDGKVVGCLGEGELDTQQTA